MPVAMVRRADFIVSLAVFALFDDLILKEIWRCCLNTAMNPSSTVILRLREESQPRHRLSAIDRAGRGEWSMEAVKLDFTLVDVRAEILRRASG